MGVMKAEIPPEVTEYKEKMFFGLTVRQLICAGIGLGLAIPTGMFGSKFLPSDVVQYAVVLEIIPCAAIGWLRINDMTFEKYAKKVIQFQLFSQKRKFKYLPELVDTQNQIKDIAYREDIENKKSERKNRKRGNKKCPK